MERDLVPLALHQAPHHIVSLQKIMIERHSKKIPVSVAAVVNEVLTGSHATLEALFREAGVPGEPLGPLVPFWHGGPGGFFSAFCRAVDR